MKINEQKNFLNGRNIEMTASKEYKAVKNYIYNNINIEEIIRVTIEKRVDEAVRKLFESYHGQMIVTQAIWAAYRGDNKPYSAGRPYSNYEAQRSLSEKFTKIIADVVAEKFNIDVTLKEKDSSSA